MIETLIHLSDIKLRRSAVMIPDNLDPPELEVFPNPIQDLDDW